MAALTDKQRDSFASRLNTIQKGGPNTMGTVYAGTAEDGGIVRQPKKRRKAKKKKDVIGVNPLVGVFAVPTAFVIGLIAMMLSGVTISPIPVEIRTSGAKAAKTLITACPAIMFPARRMEWLTGRTK